MDTARAARLIQRLRYLECAHHVAARAPSGDLYVAAENTLAQAVTDPATAEAMGRVPGPFDTKMTAAAILSEIQRIEHELEKVRNA